jgi:hypothetical protein
VAARSRRSPGRCRVDPSQRCGLAQYTSIAFAETLVLEGIAASIGSVGDAYDALAETTIGLFEAEAVGRGSPFLTGPLRIIDDVEYATMEWEPAYGACRAPCLIGPPHRGAAGATYAASPPTQVCNGNG